MADGLSQGSAADLHDDKAVIPRKNYLSHVLNIIRSIESTHVRGKYFAAGSELALLISQQTFLTYTLFDFCMNYISASGSGLLSLLKGTV